MASAAEQKNKPACERLTLCFHSKRPFESAAKATAIIDGMTVEDFRTLTTSRIIPVPSVYGMDAEFHSAFIDYLLTRWLELDPSGALSAIRNLERNMKKANLGGRGEFFEALARLRPKLLLDDLGQEERGLTEEIGLALTSLASRDPASARAYLGRFSDPQAVKNANVAIAKGIAKSDPVAAVALAKELNSPDVFLNAIAEGERVGPGVLRQVLESNAGKFSLGLSLAPLLLKYPDFDWDRLVTEPSNADGGITSDIAEEARRLTPKARQRLLENLDRVPGSVQKSIEHAVLSAWANAQPRDATEWAWKQAKTGDPITQQSDRIYTCLVPWLRKNRTEAITWWLSLPPSILRDRLSGSLIQWSVDTPDFNRVLEALSESARVSEPIVNAMASAKAKSSPAEAARLLDTLPAEAVVSSAVVNVIQAWTDKDPAAAADWLQKLPAGPGREAGLEAYTLQITAKDPQAAGQWAMEIQDPMKRYAAASYIYLSLKLLDPPGAREWLRAFPDIDQRLKERLLGPR